VTGAACGIVVLDAGPRHGCDKELAELKAKHGPLPKTVRVRAGGRGLHVHVQHPGNIMNTISQVGPALDIKADGGYTCSRQSCALTMSWCNT
jgi:hypothetical protein